MDDKSLHTLEYHKVLEKLAAYADFSVSADLASALRPTDKLEEALERQTRTTEARRLLSIRSETSIGGATDIRPQIEIAARSGVLTGEDLLNIKATLIAARELSRALERQAETYPRLSAITTRMPPPPGLIETISRTISDHGDVLDSASPKLASIRSEMNVAHERLLSRLERLINDPKNAPILQEQIITQRNGRYVIPLRADFKGRIRSIVHDQSSSGQTLFVEPLAVVELNNTWHELELAERDEERRILAELTDQVGRFAGTLIGIVDALAEMDFCLACAKYAEDLKAAEPVLVPTRKMRDGSHPGTTLKLYYARHPLLDPASVVPIDLVLDESTYALVITGPNTGGKTVTLKTVGLLALMAQSGLHIPVQSGSELSVFENIYADIGDEQSIEQSLSTFSGHITNIVRILKKADRRSLVLLDELGAGTDPQEGSALARAIMAHLVEQRVTNLVATHYPELKAFAHSTPGVVNASMEFDLKTLRPTYHLIIGLPGRSNALAICERLHVPDEIITAARNMLNPSDLKAEDLLDEIHRQRDIARRLRSDADRQRTDAEKLRLQWLEKMEKVEDERQALLEKARHDAETEVFELRGELDEVRRELSRARQPLEALKPLQQQVSALEEAAQAPVVRRQPEKAAGAPAPRPLRVGDKVKLRSLHLDGVVTALGESEVEVQIGNLRVRSRLTDIQRPNEDEQTPATQAAGSASSSPADRDSAAARPQIFAPSPGMELDLRGQRAEDALDALDRYIDNAYLSGLPFVRIIHGKGTGKLRQVIRDALRHSPHVDRWQSGQENEGGDGVTVAHLVKD
ncbi:endonuclease MutS2 [Longilinea arvoryzae]|nr:endonuclease MutS2 [Longilinea arvoryzae]